MLDIYMNTNSTLYRNMMGLPLPLRIHNHPHQLSLSNDFHSIRCDIIFQRKYKTSIIFFS